MTEFSTC